MRAAVFIAAVEGIAVLSARVEGAHCVAAISSRPALEQPRPPQLGEALEQPRRASPSSFESSSIDAPEIRDVRFDDRCVECGTERRNTKPLLSSGVL